MTLPVAFGIDPEIRLDGKSFSSILRVASGAASPRPSVLVNASSIEIVSEYIDLFAPQSQSDRLIQTISLWFRQVDGYVRLLPNEGFIKLTWTDTWTVTGEIERQRLSPFTSTSFAEASGRAEKMFGFIAGELIRRITAEEHQLGDEATPTQLGMMKDAGLGSHHEGITRQEALERIVVASEKELAAKCISLASIDSAGVRQKRCLPEGDCEVTDPVAREKSIAWRNADLQASSLRWFPTDDHGFACPLPKLGEISLVKRQNMWHFSGLNNGSELAAQHFATFEEALEYAESYLLTPQTHLYAALMMESSEFQEKEAPTILQLELLQNLYESAHFYKMLSRSEAAREIQNLYGFELMAGRKVRTQYLDVIPEGFESEV